MSEPCLNRRLKGLPHGAAAMSIELHKWDGVRHEVGRVYVYWPLVTFRCTDRTWNITHAPTGRWMTQERTRSTAIATIGRLLKCADWEFVSPHGRKAQRAKQAASQILPRLRPVA